MPAKSKILQRCMLVSVVEVEMAMPSGRRRKTRSSLEAGIDKLCFAAASALLDHEE